MNKKIVDKIFETIEQYESIYIYGHIRPDGDCYGSGFGLKEILKGLYPQKNIYLYLAPCDYLSFMGSMDYIDENKAQGSLAIIIDTSTLSRVYSDYYRLSNEIIKIDHHQPIDPFGNINLEVQEYPSCAQIITEIAIYKKVKISTFGASALYIGIATDTGWFRYRGVGEKTFNCAKYLCKYGADPGVISEILSETTLDELKFKSYVINNLKQAGKFLYCVLTKEVITEAGLNDEQASNYVSLFANIKGYPIWALILENSSGAIRIRLRSTNIDIIPLGKKYGGGGHDSAVGAKLTSWGQLESFVKDAKEYSLQHSNK